MAGFITLMNSARVAAGKPLLGFVNPLLYSTNISAPNSVNYANNFYDITSGIFYLCVLVLPILSFFLASH